MADKDSKEERTFLMLKPDAVHRGLVADIIKRFEQKGFKLVAMKFVKVQCLLRNSQSVPVTVETFYLFH